jgi:hypothetical protein
MRCRVGARLTGSGPGVSNEGRLYGYSHPAWSACTLEHRRFGSDIPRAQSESMTMMAAPESGLLSSLLAAAHDLDREPPPARWRRDVVDAAWARAAPHTRRRSCDLHRNGRVWQ